jgi:large subunit ribosomal protein L18
MEETLMARGPTYNVAFRRRREGKTDYQQRRGLVVSGLPRFVVRGSSKNVSTQLVNAEIGGDKVIVSAHSGELIRKHGWQGGGSNIPVAYLTGLLCGYKATAEGVKEAIFDIGLQAPSKGSRVFAALKGVLDAGVIIPHDENKLPDNKRIQGMHIVEYARKLSSNQDIYHRQFSNQLARGLLPEELVEHFSLVKQKISSSFQKDEVPKKGKGYDKAPEEVTRNKKTFHNEAPVKTAAKVKKRKKLEKLEEK